jgi:hypothetical protein
MQVFLGYFEKIPCLATLNFIYLFDVIYSTLIPQNILAMSVIDVAKSTLLPHLTKSLCSRLNIIE